MRWENLSVGALVVACLIVLGTAPALPAERIKLWCFGIGVSRCVSDPLPQPERVTITVCGQPAPWSADFQRRANAARRQAASPEIDAVFAEAISLRDQARRCRELNGGRNG